MKDRILATAIVFALGGAGSIANFLSGRDKGKDAVDVP